MNITRINPYKSTILNNKISFSGENSKGKTPVISYENFIKLSGKTNFDEAEFSGVPYNGAIALKNEYNTIYSKYKNGKKYSLILQDKEKGGVISFERKAEDRKREGRDILWRDFTGQFEILEKYNEKGNLTSTEFTKKDPLTRIKSYSMTTEYDKKGNVTSCGVKFLKESKGININDILSVYKAGKISKQVAKGENIQISDRVSKYVSTDIDDFGNKVIEEREVQYYDNLKDMEHPYAKSSKRIAVTGQNAYTTDYDYKTLDWTKKANPIRQFFYSEHENTIKRTNLSKGETAYIDSLTGLPYALETYTKNKTSPETVQNLETKETAKRKLESSNTVTYEVRNENNKKVKSVMFAKKSDGIDYFKPIWIEHFKEGERHSCKTERYNPENDEKTIDFFEGKKTVKREFYKGGKLVSTKIF